jgi:SAM-dependent methyltransferase
MVLGGVAIVPADLTAHLRAHGNVYRRTPIADPRMVRFVLGQAWEGGDVVPFAEVVRRYGDLAAPAGEPGAAAPASEDAALLRLLAAHAPERGRGLDVGTGVGRGTFLLAARLGLALGLDRSVARVRRARNLATTNEPFTVPGHGAPGGRDVPLDLSRLERQGVAFAAGDAEVLPVADASMDVVVLRAADGMGPWDEPLRALAEARRVAAPGALLVLEDGVDGARLGARASVLSSEPPFVAWRAA